LAVAADTEMRRRHPAGTSRGCARPNPSPSPTLNVTSSTSRQISRQARSTSGSRTWPPGTGPSPTGSRTGRAR
jgi:hypothetical protein